MPRESSTAPLSAEEQIRLHLAMNGQNLPESCFMDDSLPELNSEPFFCNIAEMLSMTGSNIMMFCMTYGVCNTVDGTVFYIAIPAQTYQNLKIELSVRREQLHQVYDDQEGCRHHSGSEHSLSHYVQGRCSHYG